MKQTLTQIAKEEPHKLTQLSSKNQTPFKKLMDILMADGSQSSDVSYRDELISEILTRETDFLSVMTNVLPVRGIGRLTGKIKWGGEAQGEYGVAEGAVAGDKRTEWDYTHYDLEKYEFPLTITWEQMAEDEEGHQLQHDMRQASIDQAKQLDDEAMEACYTAAGTNVAAADNWDDFTSPTKSPLQDIAKARTWILSNARISTMDPGQFHVIYAVEADGALDDPREYNGITTDYRTLLSGKRYSLWPSKQPTLYGSATDPYSTRDSALIVLGGDTTGRIYRYNGGKVPLVQELPWGAGRRWMTRAFWETKIVPYSGSVAASYRIYRLDNIIT